MADAQRASTAPVWLQHRSRRYTRLASIGSGTFGSVTMATDELTNVRVAIKKQNISSPECQREFAVLSALGGHPSPFVSCMLDYFTETVAPSASGRAHSVLHTVHPLADTTLWHVFKACERGVPDDRLARYMFGVASGLAHLHSLSIVHADASLKNMLVKGPDALVADFGTAYSAMGLCLEEGDEVTTRYVRAPERLCGASLVEKPADVWAFGVQVWCLHTGGCPWLQEATRADAEHIAALRQVIGPVPGGCSLRSLPKFAMLSEHAGVGSSASEASWSRWPDAMRTLCRAGFVWEPSERLAFGDILRLPALAVCRAATCPSSPSPSRFADVEGPCPRSGHASGEQGPAASRVGEPAGSDVEKETAAHDRSVGRCACSGNCGSKAHRHRARWDEPVVCGNEAKAAGAKFCMRCSCEVAGCTSSRSGGQARFRWCKLHGKDRAAVPANQYVVAAGAFELRPSWPPEVCLLARMAHILPLAEPMDSFALRKLMREVDVLQKGQPIRAGRFAVIFVAHLIKWPPVVDHFRSRVFAVPGGVDGITAELLTTIYAQCLRWANGQTWPEMFERMNGSGNRLDATSGLTVHGVRLGLISAAAADATSKKKKQRKLSDAPVLCLGRARASYVEEPDSSGATSVFSNLLEAAAQSNIVFPSGGHEVEKFADDLLALIRSVRDFRAPSGHFLQGGQGDATYQAKALSRAFLLEADRWWPEVFDALTFQRLRQWCPDVNRHAESLEDCTGEWVRERFGISPLSYHGVMCLLESSGSNTAKLREAVERALASNADAIWHAFLDDERRAVDDPNYYPPGPSTLLKLTAAAAVHED